MIKFFDYVKRSGKSLCCILLLILTYVMLDNIFLVKGGRKLLPMADLYDQDRNTVDILLLGTSHAGYNIDIQKMWEDYGYSAYILWGPSQRFEENYYYLREALKYQKPKLVLLETYAVIYNNPNLDERISLSVSQLRSWWERILLSINATDGQGWIEYALGMPKYHQRYGELDKADFSVLSFRANSKSEKGSIALYGHAAEYELTDVNQITAVKKIPAKRELYIRKIIELCQEEEIPIVLAYTTTWKREEYMPLLNHISEIASEYNVPFINFLKFDREIGILPEDYKDEGHLNYSGAKKIGEYLGKYFSESYSIPDHRGDPKYESWEIFSERRKKEVQGNLVNE